MLLLYTVCVVKQGQSLDNGVLSLSHSLYPSLSPPPLYFLYFLKHSMRKGLRKQKKKKPHVTMTFEAAQSVEKPKPVAFLCCKLDFYFHIHLWFFASIETRQ